MPHLLIVDDEETICWALRRMAQEAGHEATVVSNAEDAIAACGELRPDLVLLDVRLPGMDGLAAMAELRRRIGASPIVVMTAFGSLDTAVEAIRRGAFDYLLKPFDVDQAAEVMQRALSEQARPAADAAAAPAKRAFDDVPLLGASAAMQHVFKRIALVAGADAPVFITGESGTGKELVARALHQHSRQSAAPFVPVNLAALSPSLVESELFGHVRGAFTGAAADRTGMLELAGEGTVFFDEAGDIPANVQVKLLRVLEQREVVPVGDTRPRPTRFRAIAATNRDVRGALADGSFREDLYFRLAVFEIALPPLRERVDDVPLLAEFYLDRARAGAGGPLRFSEDAMREICRRRWPGNVRELRNAVEHAVIVARGGWIGVEHLPAPSALPQSAEATDEDRIRASVRRWADAQFLSTDAGNLHERLLAMVEPPLLEAALRAHSGQRLYAARSLGLHRATLRKKLEQFNVEAG